MLVVSVLTEKSDGVLSVVGISGWHVHVIDEVDQLILANGSISFTGLFLELLFQIHL
jgi:hypothetical protein